MFNSVKRVEKMFFCIDFDELTSDSNMNSIFLIILPLFIPKNEIKNYENYCQTLITKAENSWKFIIIYDNKIQNEYIFHVKKIYFSNNLLVGDNKLFEKYHEKCI